MDIKRIMKKYCEQLYAYKFYYLDKMDRFLKRYNLLKLTQKEIGNMNKSISIKEVESIMSKLSKQELQVLYEALTLHDAEWYRWAQIEYKRETKSFYVEKLLFMVLTQMREITEAYFGNRRLLPMLLSQYRPSLMTLSITGVNTGLD